LIHGADAGVEDDEGWTALKIAAEKGHHKIAQLLQAAGAQAEETKFSETRLSFSKLESD
jgi:ankyrin repeat protein